MVYRVGLGHLIQFLDTVDIFQGLSERELDRVASLCTESTFLSGDNLGAKAASDGLIYIVRDGEVKATIGAVDTSINVRSIRAGEAFPLAMLYEPPLLVTTDRAVTDGQALVISRKQLIELCELEPRIGMRVYRSACGILVNRYRHAVHKIART